MTYHLSTTWTIIILLLFVWDLFWRGIALWKSGRNGEKAWFLAILVLNSAGILPIFYLSLRDLQNNKSS